MNRLAVTSTLALVGGLVAFSASNGSAAGPQPSSAVVGGVVPIATVQSRTVTSVSVESLAELLQDAGYRAKIDHTPSGRPMIVSSTGGIKFTIVLYDPTGDKDHYEDIQVGAWFNDSFEGTMDDANAWNMKKRHAYAVYDKSDNSVGVSMDLTFKGGVTEDYIEEYFRLWDQMIGSFSQYLADAH